MANLKMKRGTDFVVRLQVADAARDPMDLTGAVVSFRLLTRGQTRYTAVSSDVGSLTTIDGPAGEILLHLSPEETAAVPAGVPKYDYDVLVERADNFIFSPLEGEITMTGEQVRA